MTDSPTNGNGSSRWMVLVAAAGIVATIVGAIWAFSSNNAAVTQTVATNSTNLKNLSEQYTLLVDRLQTIRSEQTAHTADIRGLSKDVTALQTDLREVSGRQAEITTAIAGIRRDMVEVETQFCASDAFRNLTHATDLRDMAILWAKTMGSELPISNAYYPKIGRCGGEAR